MDDDHQLVLIAAYPSLETAQTDFDEVERRLKHGLEMRAAALVSKDNAGEPHVVEAANHHGRFAFGVGAGLGVLFGLFAPPLARALFVGGATAGAVAAFAEHELRTKLQHEVGEALAAGTAVILAVVYPNGREPMELTLGNASAFRELRLDRSTVNGIERSIAEVMSDVTTGKTDTSS
ncbi:MAG: sulfatase [Mycobacterium sp.]